MHATSPRILFALSTLVLAGVLGMAATPVQAGDWFGGKTVAGSGNPSSVKRELTPFHGIAVDIHGKIELIQGNTESVVVEADDNHLPLIETVVTNGQLRIRTLKGFNLPGSAKVKVMVHMRNIDKLSLAGSADVTAARLSSPKLAGNIDGSGSITIKELQSDDLAISIAGSGRFEAQGSARAMDVSIAGSGDAVVWVRKALSVSITGSGEVRYYGEANPREASTRGSGRVKQLGASLPV